MRPQAGDSGPGRHWLVELALWGAILGVILGLVALTAKREHYDPPGLSEVRAAVARIPFPARVRQDKDVRGVRVFRGQASSDGVTVRFVLLAGRDAHELVYPRVRMLVAGFRDPSGGIGLDTGEGRLIILEDSERALRATPAQKNTIFRIALRIEDALTALG